MARNVATVQDSLKRQVLIDGKPREIGDVLKDSALSGLLSVLGPLTGSLGPFNGGRTRLLAPCPGGGAPPAADRSNPWSSLDTLPAERFFRVGSEPANKQDDVEPVARLLDPAPEIVIAHHPSAHVDVGVE